MALNLSDIYERLTMGRPDFYGLARVKAALVNQLGAAAAAAAYAQGAGFGANWTGVRLRLASLQHVARSEGLIYEEIIPSTTQVFPPPTVFGGTSRLGFETTTRCLFFCILRDTVVSSKSNILINKNRALLDFQADELSKVPLDLHVDPIIVAKMNGSVMALMKDMGAQRKLKKAICLTGLHSYAFGHWIIEFLPKIWAIRDRLDFRSVPILIDEQMPIQHREALQFFAGDQPIIVLKPLESVLVESLWMCSMPVYMPLGPMPSAQCAPDLLALDTKAFTKQISKLAPDLERVISADSPKLIYLARKPTQRRLLVNYQEVEAWCSNNGFAVVDFADLSFEDQVRLVRGADAILGPDGSSLLMTFFAKPGTRIGIFSHSFLEDNEWYSQITSDLGQEHSFLIGEVVRANTDYRGFSDYRIDTNTLPAFLSHLGIAIAAR